MPTQLDMWNQIDETEFDLVIIGGGINGTGIARDASRRGLKVCLLEMRDIAYGTSSRSSKLIHGGFRYLEQYQFGLVFESVSERKTLTKIAPHLVRPMGFIYPVYKHSKHSLMAVNAGMWIYDSLSLFRSPKMHKNLNRSELSRYEPCLEIQELRGAPLYFDCATDDARLSLETALDACEQGAVICTYAMVSGFHRNEAGELSSVTTKNGLTGAEKIVRGKCFINATGAWTDHTLAMADLGRETMLRPTKGVHFVVRHEVLPINHAVICVNPKDGRSLFAIPWNTHTYVGTTDTDYTGDPKAALANASDIEYMIKGLATYFPENLIEASDIISTWCGIRPLITPPSANLTESAISREHEIHIAQDGLITVAGGKLTTYRKMSAEVVERAIPKLRQAGVDVRNLRKAQTATEPLPGGRNWPLHGKLAPLEQEILHTSQGTLNEEQVSHLIRTYGTRAIEIATLCQLDSNLSQRISEDRPEIMAQIVFGIQNEWATTISDILIQRTQLFYKQTNQALEATEKVADFMATLLSWTPEEKQQQIHRYRHDVKQSRQWQNGFPALN